MATTSGGVDVAGDTVTSLGRSGWGVIDAVSPVGEGEPGASGAPQAASSSARPTSQPRRALVARHGVTDRLAWRATFTLTRAMLRANQREAPGARPGRRSDGQRCLTDRGTLPDGQGTLPGQHG